MAATVQELMEWLKDLDPYDQVGIDEGGLCLRAIGKREAYHQAYYEIGGIPEEEKEEGRKI